MSRNECEAIRPLISAALDGELDEEDFVRLSEHLASCTHCRQVRQDYQHLRDEIRSVDSPTPPPVVTQTIRQETIEKPPPSPIVRLVSRAGLRFGMSTAAASIVLLLVLAFFGYHEHQQRTIPAIASSEPVQELSTPWPRYQPIKINFSKPMNQQSVEDNLRIQPLAERDRLPTSWDGNTLVIGRSETRNVMLLDDTDYTITILPHAEDIHGNPIGESWTLSFRTGPKDVAVATPSPEAEQEPREAETPEVTNDTQVSTEQSPARTPSLDEAQDQTSGDASSERSDNGATSASTGENDRQDDPVNEPEPDGSSDDSVEEVEQPSPTATTAPAEPEEPPAPSPTATPTPEPTATATPDPTATPSPTETEEPSPTPSPSTDPIPVRGAFGEVYWGNEYVQVALGEPTQAEFVELASEQEFQRGVMFRRVDTAGFSIFVFVHDGTVINYRDTWTPEDDEVPGEAPSDDLHVPQGHFGKVWYENPSEVRDQIGYALSAEPVPNFDARMQGFENGTMIYSRGLVYVIYSDNTWERFVDGSSGGFQSDESLEDDADDGSSTSDADDHHVDDDEPVDEDDTDGETEYGDDVDVVEDEDSSGEDD